MDRSSNLKIKYAPDFSVSLFEESDDKELKIPCKWCDGNETYHTVCATVRQSNDEYERSWECIFSDYGDFQILLCKNCNAVSFREDRWTSEDYDTEYVENLNWEIETLYKVETKTKVYPPSWKRIHLANKYGKSLPTSICHIYNEVYDALYMDLRVLACIGIRKLIESICKQKKVPWKKLYHKIENLKISWAQKKILHRLRDFWNDSTHTSIIPTIKQLDAALDITEHMIKTIYIIPRSVKDLSKERKRSVKKKTLF